MTSDRVTESQDKVFLTGFTQDTQKIKEIYDNT